MPHIYYPGVWPGSGYWGGLREMFSRTDAALAALDIACGVSSELLVFTETRRLKGLHQLHELVYYEMSYHLITARGALRLMLNVQPRPSLFFLASSCLMATLEHAGDAARYIEEMRQDAPSAYQGAVEATSYWTNQSIFHTQQALNIAVAMSGEKWPKMLEEIKEFQEEIGEIREKLGLE